ncbi:hypothetical protein V6N13_012405 [Hibiscus sabdariffa]
MVLTTCMLYGRIATSIGNMTSLVDLELSGNFLSGQIPMELGLLKDLEQLGLLGNLTKLRDMDMSANLSGQIPQKLIVFYLSENNLSGPLPAEICQGEIGNLKNLNLLLLQGSKLGSSIPSSLSLLKSLNVLDLSNNRMTGKIPESL